MHMVDIFDGKAERAIRFWLRIAGKEVDGRLVEGVIQFLKFGIVGLSNTFISYGIYVGTVMLIAPWNLSWDYYAGNIVGFLLSVLWSFYWNSRVVFTPREGEQRRLLPALMKTYASYAFSGLVLSNILSFFWIEMAGVSKMIAPLLNLVVSVPINFLLNKMWAFRS